VTRRARKISRGDTLLPKTKGTAVSHEGNPRHVHQKQGACRRRGADLAGGLSGIGTVAASAATPQCGSGCVEVYSAKYATATSLGWVETVLLGIPLQGVPTEVRPASDSNPAEDLIIPTGPR
jgi:hypothetical protein